MTDRDALWVDPVLTEMATAEAKRLQRAIVGADTMDGKQIYRGIMDVAIRFTLARSVGETVPANKLDSEK